MKPVSSTDVAVYRGAARLMELGFHDYACNAIWTASHPRKEWRYPDERDRHPLVVKFTEYFKPERNDTVAWFGEAGRGRRRRIIALCMMAAMVEAGDA